MDVKRYNDKTNAAYKHLLSAIESNAISAIELQLYRKEAGEIGGKTALDYIYSIVRGHHECVRDAGVLLNGGQD